jgi:hypothetical protein
MIRHKWIVGFRNQLSTLFGECNSCAAIEGSRLTRTEREDLRKILLSAIEYVDKRIMK